MEGFATTYRAQLNNHPFTINETVLTLDPADLDNPRTIQWFASADGETISLDITFIRRDQLHWESCHRDGSDIGLAIQDVKKFRIRTPKAVAASSTVFYHADIVESRNARVKFNGEEIEVDLTANRVDGRYAFQQAETRDFQIRFRATDGAHTITLFYTISNGNSADLSYPDEFTGAKTGFNTGETFFFGKKRTAGFALPREGGRIALMSPGKRRFRGR